MINIQEIINGEGYHIITFLDEKDAYGMLLCEDCIEFMEFDDDAEVILITEEETPEEYNRLKNKYLEEVMKQLDL